MQHFSIEQIKASVRIEDIVRRRGIVLRASQGGERLEGHCPFHPFDETPSFNLYLASQHYHCFGCGADGDVIDFVQAFDVCSFQEALHRLSGNIIALPTAQLIRFRVPRPVLPVPFPLQSNVEKNHCKVLTHFQHLYHQTLLTHTSLCGKLQLERGIAEEGILKCGLGYADGSLVGSLRASEWQQEALEVGLLSITQRERMWQRLIIPECIESQCSWMIGRTLHQQPENKRSPKYLGLSLSKPLLGYGLALKLLQKRHLVRAILIVEGAIDYVIATQWNLPIVCVALVGTHASLRQFMMLQDLHQRAGYTPILISLDADEAGRQASQHLLAHLNREKQIARELPPLANIKDIGDLGIHPQGRTMLQAVLEQALCS